MRLVRLYVLTVTAILLVAGSYRLMWVDAGVPTHWPSEMRFTTPCLTSTVGLTQSFQVTAEAVAGITLLPAIASGTSGEVFFELRDGATDGGAVRHKAAMPIADLATDAPLTVKIPPVTAPADGRFTLWIGRSDDTGCLAFQASAMSAPEARLDVGGREVLGDLLFQIHADRATVLDGLQRWLAATTRIHLPSSVIVVLAVVYAIAIGVLCWMLTPGRGARADATATPERAAE
jgi:hypothetical protein